jgi:hypothetical protein
MQINGNIDRLDQDFIEGWITVADEPARKLTLDVMLDETVIGHAVADEFREDLQQAGIGDGRCAFSFNVPAFLPKSDRDRLQIRLENSIVYLATPAFHVGAAEPMRQTRALIDMQRFFDIIASLDRLERGEDAFALLRERVALCPDQPDYALALAGRSLQYRSVEESLAFLAATYHRFPEVAETYTQYADALLTAGRADEAEAILTAGRARFPELTYVASSTPPPRASAPIATPNVATTQMDSEVLNVAAPPSPLAARRCVTVPRASLGKSRVS